MPRRRAGLVVCVLLTSWVLAAGAAPALDPFRALDLGPPARPRPAPDFTLPRLSGGTISMKELRGRPVLVNFWTSWCLPCRSEMPSLDKLYREYRDRGFVVIGVSLDRSPDVVRQFVKETDVTFPIVLDPDWHVADRFRVLGLPGTFVVGPDGDVRAFGFGPREWDSALARTMVETLLRDSKNGG